MKIVVTRKLLQADQEYIKEGLEQVIGKTFELIIPKKYDEEDILEVCSDADILLGPYITKKILAKCNNLKLIQIPWAGMDSFNFSVMENSQIPVCNSHSNANIVAEMGVSIILDLLKKISYHDRKMRNGNWNRDQKPLNLTSKDISKQKICIIGYGNIGTKLGEFLSVFGAKILAVDNKKRENERKISIYNTEKMMEAVKVSDVVVLTLPLTEKTKNMVNNNFISQMKEGAYLVVLSRAEIVDEHALYKALVSGKLNGYGSDVWWKTPKRGNTFSHVSENYRFEKMEQIVFSPHRAGYSEGNLPHLDDVILNISNLKLGKPLINIIKIEEQY